MLTRLLSRTAAVVVCLFALATTQAALGQGADPPGGRRAELVNVGGSVFGQAHADLDGGGSYGVTAVLLRAGWMSRVGRAGLAGVSVSVAGYDFDFDNPVAFGGAPPWERVQHLGLGVPVLWPAGGGWTLFATPALDVFRESGADSDDAVSWGAVLGATYTAGPGRSIGVGVGVFDRLEETRGFPFLSVNWELSERLRLGNPLRAGPTGPAGLELVYALGNGWDAAAGFAYRSLRFRLDDEGLAPAGIGEQRAIPVFARVSRGLGSTWELDLYAGRAVNGELRLEDERGNRLVTEEHENPAFVAATLRGLF